MTDPGSTSRKGACIFPAFGAEYFGNEQDILESCSCDFASLVDRAAAAVDFSVAYAVDNPGGSVSDELQSQYATYLYSCAMSDLLLDAGMTFDCCAGYSMGIYAALYHCGSCSFEDGLFLIRRAYDLIAQAAGRYDFGMGVVVGSDLDDLKSLIAAMKADVEIINVNNRHSFSVAGIRNDVVAVLEAIRLEGALNVRLLPMRAPYHSRHMDRASHLFRDYCATLPLADPAVPLVSTVDRSLLQTRDDIVGELARNINHNINWHETMTAMVGRGVTAFYECGPGRTLQKLAKFIDGEFSVITMKKLPEILARSTTSP